MKKILLLLLSCVLAFSMFAGCGETTDENNSSYPLEKVDASGKKFALVTDIGDLNDHGYNQYTYEGVKTFVKENGGECKYYRSTKVDEAAYEEAVKQAAKDGNNVIICLGSYISKACYNAAKANPEVMFLGFDITLEDMGVETLPSNIAIIKFHDEQAGFLAGYAAVADGYKKLGFLGGDVVPAVTRFGNGYIYGAEKAATELNVDGVSINHWYSGTFINNDSILNKATEWYQNGTEVIFSCGGEIYNSCLAAANAENGLMIGVDVDQSYLNKEIFITSAEKGLSYAVMMAFTDVVKNNMVWDSNYAGKIQVFGAKENAISLQMKNARFKKFTKAKYDELYKALADGTIVVPEASDPEYRVDVKKITVDYQK